MSILSLGGENIIEESGIGSPSSGILVSTSSTSEITSISGVNIDQRGSSNHGVTLKLSGNLKLENCYIRGSGNGYGINFIPTSGANELYISNCVIADNGSAAGGGILIKPSGAGSAVVVLDNVRIENNRTGIQVDGTGTSGSILVTVRNSTAAGSAAFGFNAIDSGGGATNVMIEGSSSAGNGTHGVVANGANATVRMRDSTVSGNDRGLLPVASGKIISQGGNTVAGNTTNGAFTSSLPLQ